MSQGRACRELSTGSGLSIPLQGHGWVKRKSAAPAPAAFSLPDAERSRRRAKGKKRDSKRKGREGPKRSPEKKEKMKAAPDSVLGQLGEYAASSAMLPPGLA